MLYLLEVSYFHTLHIVLKNSVIFFWVIGAYFVIFYHSIDMLLFDSVTHWKKFRLSPSILIDRTHSSIFFRSDSSLYGFTSIPSLDFAFMA